MTIDATVTSDIPSADLKGFRIMTDNKKRQLMPAADRREQILTVAVAMAAENHYQKITRDEIAQRAGVAMGLVTKYFSTMAQLRRDIMRAAIREKNLTIIAQGLVAKDSHALKASHELKVAATAELLATSTT